MTTPSKMSFDPAAYEREVKQRLIAAMEHTPLVNLADFISNEVRALTQLTSFNYKFKCFMEDGAYAVHRAVLELLGFAHHSETGPSKKPPETIDVMFADGKRIKVPWGTIAIPGLGSDAQITMSYDDDERTLFVSGKCEKQFVSLLDAVITRAQAILREDSIYKGHAIRLDADLKPEFIDLSKIDSIPQYLTPAVKFAIKPILARLEKTEQCRRNKLDLKFGALLEGPYGTGKTLLAFKLARIATLNNWTFIYLVDPTRTVEMLEIANELSGTGNGVVVFVEDIDRVLNGEERNETVNRILNVMDGGDNKKAPIISIFTTNHVNRINRTFVRGKRTGAIISLTHLDEATAKEFIVSYMGDKLVGDVDTAAKAIAERKVMPSFLAEILDGVAAHMIYDEADTITENEILYSLDAYKAQMELSRMSDDTETEYEVFQRLYRKYMIQNGVKNALVDAQLQLVEE